MRAMVMLIRSEAKMTLREPADLLIPFGLPVLMLVMLGFQVRNSSPVAGDHSALDVIGLPVAFTTTVALIGIINMPTLLTAYRETGVLRRLAVTPVSPLKVLGARVTVSVLQTFAGIALAYTIGVIAFGARPPTNLLTALGVIGLTTVAMYSLGMILASLAPSPNTAVACGFVLFLGFGALGGMFGDPRALPESLAMIGAWMPFGAAVKALGAAWIGAAIPTESLLSLGACTTLGVVVSALTFRWTR